MLPDLHLVFPLVLNFNGSFRLGEARRKNKYVSRLLARTAAHRRCGPFRSGGSFFANHSV